MNNIIETSELELQCLPILTDEEAKIRYNKGWSFFNIYSLRELRDIYLVHKENINLNVPKLSKIVNQKVNYEDKIWSERRVLENINALKNIKLLDQDGGILKDIFSRSEINSPLTKDELSVFSDIFFSYFRFKELSSWFISPSKEFHKDFEKLTKANFIDDSKPILYFADKNRFTDTFLYDDQPLKDKYIISNKMSHLMRFWDVYLKWGLILGIIDKFNLSTLNIKTKDNKELSMAYFTKPFVTFDLMDYIRDRASLNTRNIFIPQLIFEIAKENRYSVNEIKAFIISQIQENDKLTYERTSEIFIIKGKQSKKKIREATYLYPTINDNYVSHLIIRK